MTNSRTRSRSLGAGKDPYVLDTLDLRIIGALQEDGRLTLTEIGSMLGVSHVTVRNRLERMLSKGLLEVRGYVNPDALGLRTEVVIGIRAELTQVTRLADELAAFEEVTFCAVTAGRYDIMIAIAAASDGELLEFIQNKLARLSGVRDTESFHILALRKRRVQWKIPQVRVHDALAKS